MAKVFGVIPIELKDGVRGDDFEKFWLEEYAPMGLKLGWISHLLKGDRGERKGKYAVIWEIPDVSLRDRFVTEEGITEEIGRVLGPEFDILGKKFDTFVLRWPFTDYIELGK